MNITSAQYINDAFTGQQSSIKVVIDNQELFVPLTPGNRHYDEIMRQVEENIITIQPAE